MGQVVEQQHRKPDPLVKNDNLRFLPIPGPDRPADRVHPRYNILIRTGRTSSHYPRWGTITSLEVEVTDEIVETTVNIELKPGSFSLHDAYVIHGSEPNRSNDFRKIYTMRTPSNLGRRNGGFPFS